MNDVNSGIESGLADVYGSQHLKEDLSDLKGKHPDTTPEEILQIYEKEPTCKHSFFGREANLRILSEFMAEKPNKHWQILSAGCGNGPEPFEIALRLMAYGADKYNISGFDTSPKAIEQARSGHVKYLSDWIRGDLRAKFLEGMREKKLLKSRKVTKRPSGWDLIEYDLSDQILNKLHFCVHDLIDKPFKSGNKKYDVIFANNLLMHYPQWTRNLMLIHLLSSLKDQGRISFERQESLGGIGSTPDRAAWLAPYYKWREDLTKFGLKQIEIKNETAWLPLKLWQYQKDDNQFANKRFAIRDKQLVEI